MENRVFDLADMALDWVGVGLALVDVALEWVDVVLGLVVGAFVLVDVALDLVDVALVQVFIYLRLCRRSSHRSPRESRRQLKDYEVLCHAQHVCH